ncbi:hypothetical protein [Marinobacter sp. DS40M6]|uniref:hypothetical protein n=1 Tax=Marinobacter sp. DS40M6 TaxID=1597776 RepID=UPI0023593FD3|nr:hypothetical protein [Marinobacter sp. DS40M6]MDC8454685.1 hypothetical protein [Marinobacter sp. DS40M6]
MDSRDSGIKWVVVGCVIFSLWIGVFRDQVGVGSAVVITLFILIVGYFAKME